VSALVEAIADAQARRDPDRLIAAIPFMAFLGMRGEVTPDGLVTRLPYTEALVGNPFLPALHGGVLGGFMEGTAILQLLWNNEAGVIPKTIDFSIDYLRSARARPCAAICRVVRQGQRIANCAIELWQEDRASPVAVARAHFLLAK
jgi:uncharacterized protein (TIGR00369 family)